jgi:Nucleotide-diphospho-sugar transferase
MTDGTSLFGETTMFTIATADYVPFVRNLVSSMAASGLDPRRLDVYALDDETERRLAGTDASLLGRVSRHESAGVDRWSDFETAGFTRVMLAKFSIAAGLFRSGTNALYVDSDIVFRRDPTSYLAAAVRRRSSEMTMQFEWPENEYNAGFWYARATHRVLSLFEEVEQALLASVVAGEFTDDQDCFNRLVPPTEGLRFPSLRRRRVRVQALDVKLFACGNQFYDDPAVAESAYVLHFNYLVGKRAKLLAMERFGAVLHPDLREELRRETAEA